MSSVDGLDQELLIDNGIDTKNNRIYLFHAVDARMLSRLIQGLTILNPNKKPIDVFLNTEGGLIETAHNISQLISKNEQLVSVIAVEKCMSAGIIILQSGHQRLAFPKTAFVVHFGEETNVSKQQRTYNMKQDISMREAVLKKIKSPKSRKAVNSWLEGEHFFSAEEALTVNLVDALYEGGI